MNTAVPNAIEAVPSVTRNKFFSVLKTLASVGFFKACFILFLSPRGASVLAFLFYFLRFRIKYETRVKFFSQNEREAKEIPPPVL
jgi:hypothetical protein